MTFSEADVQSFAELTGERNPVHLDEEYASKSRFGRRIAHGMLTASLVSSVLANQLPGVERNPGGMRYALLICPVACVLSALSLRRGSKAALRQ